MNCITLASCLLAQVAATPAPRQQATNARAPRDDADLRRWLENMVWYHRFSSADIQQATGMPVEVIDDALKRFKISPETRPARNPGAPVLVVPYPGGRHPRIGFLDGAVNPQRETKLSVFTPWDQESYVVVDLPEAIWSNLGLTYLAHTHIDTIWTKQQIALEPLEWTATSEGGYRCRRLLPNGIAFEATATPDRQGVDMMLELTNGTVEPLSDLRVQVCVMLKGAKEFSEQTNENKVIREPFVAARSADGKRAIITTWEPIGRAWANPPVPCIHADPKFPDCPPGATVRVRGRLWFYEGDDLAGQLVAQPSGG